MKRKYLFAFIYDIRDCLFRDILVEGSPFIYLPSHKVYENKVINFVEKCSLSYQLNSKMKVPFQKIFFNLEQYRYEENVEYFIVIPNSSIAKLTVEYLERFKKKRKNVKLIALLVDSMHGSSIQMSLVTSKLESDVWDYILTYDKYDAEEFGFYWIGYTYYSAHLDACESNRKSDLFCISSPKGRIGTYAELYNQFRLNGIDCNFRIFTHSKERFLPNTQLEYMHHFMNYDDVVGEIKASNCILEILQPNQKMQTIRYFEAVVYNKKLLTNNPYLAELPFYNSRFMRVFNDLRDIDYDWIKSKEDIQYRYNGEFSPNELIETLNMLD